MKKLFYFISLYFSLWKKHHIPMRAAALTYTFILALVPAITVCLSVFSFFVDVKQLQNQLKIFLLRNLTGSASSTVSHYLDSFIVNVRFTKMGYVGFAALLFTSLTLLASIEGSINEIWYIKKSKHIWKRVIEYNIILIFGPLCLSLSIAASTFATKYFPQFLVHANFGAIAVNTIFISLIYKILPNIKIHFPGAFLSGLLVALASGLTKLAFARYTSQTLIYNKLYGSLAALPLFLIWIYLNWSIFLGGTLLNYLLQNRKKLIPEAHNS